VKCTRCRNEHRESERISRPRPRRSRSEIQVDDLVCPRCGCTSFYDCTPQVAWCWASGLIEIGDAMPADGPDGSGAIEIACGPRYALKPKLEGVARHGKGANARQLLAPGVPEAEGQVAKCDALIAWLTWCRKSKSRDGVVFSEGVAA